LCCRTGFIVYLPSEYICFVINLGYMRFACIIFFLSLIFSACKNETLDNFDTKKWKDDLKGCKNRRLSLIEVLEKQKEKLMGLSQSQVVGLLGKPDAQELLKRNAKTFTYYLSEGSQCGRGSHEGVALVIHFGALNYVNEIRRSRYQ